MEVIVCDCFSNGLRQADNREQRMHANLLQSPHIPAFPCLSHASLRHEYFTHGRHETFKHSN